MPRKEMDSEKGSNPRRMVGIHRSIAARAYTGLSLLSGRFPFRKATGSAIARTTRAHSLPGTDRGRKVGLHSSHSRGAKVKRRNLALESSPGHKIKARL